MKQTSLEVSKVYDCIIRRAKVIDGTGAPWYWGEIGIRDGLIVKVGTIPGRGVKELDAGGHFVAPGFIDIHTHSDESLLADPGSPSKITQGVTTEVIGNCGYSAAPAVGLAKQNISRNLVEFELSLKWESFHEYLEQIAKSRPSVNVYPLVGHGTLRLATSDPEGNSKEILPRMKELLAEALTQGARGLSTGLVYPPGCFAQTEELIELCQVVHKYGGIYTSHLRNEGNQLLKAVQEAIDIGAQTGVRVEISHLKAAGPTAHGLTAQALELMAEARQKGVDVAYDAYPYTASSTGLAAHLPKWAHEGGEKAMVARLSEAFLAQRLAEETQEIVASRGGWAAIQIASISNPDYRWLLGDNLAHAAEVKAISPWELARELLLKNKEGVEVICFSMDQAEVDRVITHPWATYGSDATARAPQGVLAKGVPHPRAYGTFPRIIRRYVRESREMTLEDAIRKMTSAPAGRLGLLNRGLIRPAMAADLVCFDLEHLEDLATYTQPHRFCQGIDWVTVNGALAFTVTEGVLRPGHGQILKFQG